MKNKFIARKASGHIALNKVALPKETTDLPARMQRSEGEARALFTSANNWLQQQKTKHPSLPKIINLKIRVAQQLADYHMMQTVAARPTARMTRNTTFERTSLFLKSTKSS